MRERRGKARRLNPRQFAGRPPEVGLRCGFHAKNPISELGRIQIQLEDAVLRKEEFKAAGHNQLAPLSEEGPTLRQIEIARQLLGEGTAPPQLVAVALGVGPSGSEGIPPL